MHLKEKSKNSRTKHQHMGRLEPCRGLHKEKNKEHVLSVGKGQSILNPSVLQRVWNAINMGKKGHYGRVCKSVSAISAITEDDSSLFLGTVDADEDTWTVDISRRHTKVRFKIHTGT